MMCDGFEPCPFCGGQAKVKICDSEGNPKQDSYLDNPWSGVAYCITHPEENTNGDCVIMTVDDELVGSFIYDTLDEARDAWNRRFIK